MDGTVRCWGRNDSGQLGNGTDDQGGVPTPGSTTPVVVSGISDAIGIAADTNQACSILSDQSVKCWGVSDYGQLGDNTNVNRTNSVPVRDVSGAIQVASGDSHTCALIQGGSVKCWGRGDAGQLGDAMNASANTPVVVSGISDATRIAAGGFHACALLYGGSARCWGQNTPADANPPQLVSNWPL
ncbi:MAG: hypothetical protein KGP28_11595 [Bdellovibrionales bacterium]|nr:hypothetical protein [Bdellovibrionales bacterium]